MNRYQSFMTDCPEKESIYASVSYCTFSFALIPYFLSLFGIGFDLNSSWQLWIDFGYHILNFLVAVCLFRGHLGYSFLNVSMDPKKFLKITLPGAFLMLAVGVLAFIAGVLLNNVLLSQCALPITEMDLFSLSSVLVTEKPILGTVCMVLLTPFTTSLLYYATGFAPVCNNRPWLAYLVTAVFLAIPRIINAVTFWIPSEQFMLYLVQLPIHLIACRLYQKSDTVWAPILAHMLVNLVVCILLLLFIL